MEQSKPMGMIRLDREEEVYDREKVLGRDIKTVFPTEIRKAEKESNVETFRAIFGDDKRFVTESELSEIQKRRHGDAETSEPSKPLADVLRENKEAKEAAFQASWKDMKTGKNRPLTAEELEFFDELADTSAREKRRERLREEEELELFRLEHQATAEARGSLPDDPGTGEAAPLSAAPLSAAPLSAAPLSAASLSAATRSAAPEPQMAAKGSAGVMIALPAMGKVRARLVTRSAEPESKRARPAEENKADPAEDPAEVEGDLAGLLGAYATSSEDEA